MKALLIWSIFGLLMACDGSVKSGLKNAYVVSGTAKPYTPVHGEVFKSITLKMTTSDPKTAVRSTDIKKNEGEFIGVEGEFNFLIEVDAKVPRSDYDLIFKIKTLKDQNFITKSFTNESVTVQLDPAIYLLEIQAIHKIEKNIKMRLDPTLIVQCKNSAKNFTLDASKLSITPLCEKNPSPVFGQFNTVHPQCWNFGVHLHDLSRVIVSSEPKDEFFAYYDCDGDDLFDYLSFESVLKPLKCYSSFASTRSARYRIVDQCGNFEDLEVNPMTVIRSTPMPIYQTVEKEDGDIERDVSQLTQNGKEFFVQANLVSSTSSDKRINGFLSFIGATTNEPVDIICDFKNNRVNVSAESLDDKHGQSVSLETTGYYNFSINLNNLVKLADGSYDEDALRFDSVVIDIPGQGDKVRADSLSTKNCDFNVNLNKETTDVGCGAGYSGEHLVHTYLIEMDYSCPELKNGSNNLSTKLTHGELRCKPGMGSELKKCTPLPCGCTTTSEPSNELCPDGTPRTRYTVTCTGQYAHCKAQERTYLSACPGQSPPQCSCTPIVTESNEWCESLGRYRKRTTWSCHDSNGNSCGNDGQSSLEACQPTGPTGE